jgi:hypothetical protein
MSRTQKTAQGRGRRWHHLRPAPRRRADFMGFNITWWVLWWLILAVLVVYPGPYW